MKKTFEVRTHKLSPLVMLSQAHTLNAMVKRNPWLKDPGHRHLADYEGFGQSYKEAIRSVGRLAAQPRMDGFVITAREMTETGDGQTKPQSNFRNVGFARTWQEVSYDYSMGIGLDKAGTVVNYWLDAAADQRHGEAEETALELHRQTGRTLLELTRRNMPEGSTRLEVATFVNPHSEHSPLGLMSELKQGSYGIVHVLGADNDFERDNRASAVIYDGSVSRSAIV